MEPQALREFIRSRMPGADVQVFDMTGTRDHFEIEIVSPSFEGESTLERHRRVHGVLAPLMDREVHAVRLKIRTPAEKEKRP